MRGEELYLRDIVAASETLAEILTGATREGFLADKVLQLAVLQLLQTMGEASARLPEALKGRWSNIPWKEVVAFRNFAVHAYFAVKWEIVWDTAVKSAPELREAVAAILAAEYPAGVGEVPSPAPEDTDKT